VALEKQTTPEGKSQVYSMKASVAASGSGGTNYSIALEYARQADTTAPDPSTAANIGFYYRKLDQIQEAITWYETALERFGDRAELEPMQEADYLYYEVVIEELKGEA
jgi:tetratricopeptide (TPR) repeat protein